METLWQDGRYAVRTLRRSAAFTTVVVLTLAVGIGANSAIFSVLNAVLLRPLPYHDPSSLVSVWPAQPHTGAEFSIIAHNNRSFQEVAAYAPIGLNLVGRADAQRVSATAGTAALFAVLNAQPEVGRTFRPGEDEPGKAAVVVLSHALWQQRFGADPAVVGQVIVLDERPYTVIGIMPKAFYFPSPRTQLWIPAVLDPNSVGEFWGSGGYQLIARLRPGLTIDRSVGDLRRLASLIREQNPLWKPGPDFGSNASVVSLRDYMVGSVRTPLIVLFGAVGFVLLIACVNVANLLIARSAARQRLLAIRVALGANQRRLLQQQLVEGLLLSLLGAVAGLAIAAASVRALATALLADTPRPSEVGVDPAVVVFTLLLSVATGVIVGLLPATRSMRLELQPSLSEGSRSGTGSSGRRLTDGLVALEVGLAVVLVAGAALLIRSFWDLRHVALGFRPEGVIAAHLTPSSLRLKDADQMRTFYGEVLSRVKAIPGVQRAAAVSELPLDGQPSGHAFRVEGQFENLRSQLPSASYHVITPEYLETMGIPLIHGRRFNDFDRESSPGVALVSQSLAKHFWPSQDAVGKRIGPPWKADWITIVGVVGDVRDDSLSGALSEAIYRPFAQAPRTEMTLVLRTPLSQTRLAGIIRQSVSGVDGTVPVANVRSVSETVSQSVLKPRATMQLLALFAAIALFLGAIGIYGVLTEWVGQRMRDIGVRIALGASGGAVVRLVVFRGAMLAFVGALVGMLVALAVTRSLEGLLYHVSAVDPAAFIVAPLALLGVAIVASYIPAHRAARIDPVIALRNS